LDSVSLLLFLVQYHHSCDFQYMHVVALAAVVVEMCGSILDHV